MQLLSRGPTNAHKAISASLGSQDDARRLESAEGDITKPETLASAFEGANVVINLVGIMHGSPDDFARIQWRGAENVARAAERAGAKLIHISAIGADASSDIPYVRTKALGERAVFEASPSATVIRPSIISGPGDEFFGVSTVNRGRNDLDEADRDIEVRQALQVSTVYARVWGRAFEIPAGLRRRRCTRCGMSLARRRGDSTCYRWDDHRSWRT